MKAIVFIDECSNIDKDVFDKMRKSPNSKTIKKWTRLNKKQWLKILKYKKP